MGVNFNFKGVAMRLARKQTRIPKKNKRPHELVLFAKLDPEESTYTFNLKHEDAIKVLAIAKGLKDRDGFIATGMAIGVWPVKVVGGAEYPSASVPAYFDDINVFTEAAGAATLSEREAVCAVWSGAEVTLQTNEDVRIDSLHALEFRTALTTQGSASTQNEQDGSEMKSLGAGVPFGGGDTNLITLKITCKDKTHLAGNADRANYIVIRLVGSVLKGATTALFTE